MSPLSLLSDLLRGPSNPLLPGLSRSSTARLHTPQPTWRNLATLYPVSELEKWPNPSEPLRLASKVLQYVDTRRSRQPDQAVEDCLPLRAVWPRALSFSVLGSGEAAQAAFVERYFLEPANHVLSVLAGTAYAVEPQYLAALRARDRVVISSHPHAPDETAPAMSLRVHRHDVQEAALHALARRLESKDSDIQSRPQGIKVLPFPYPVRPRNPRLVARMAYRRITRPHGCAIKLQAYELLLLQARKHVVQSCLWGILASERALMPCIQPGLIRMLRNRALGYLGMHLLRLTIPRAAGSEEPLAEIESLASELLKYVKESFRPVVELFKGDVPPAALPMLAGPPFPLASSTSSKKPSGGGCDASKSCDANSSGTYEPISPSNNSTPNPHEASNAKDSRPATPDSRILELIYPNGRRLRLRPILRPSSLLQTSTHIHLTKQIGSGVLGKVYAGKWAERAIAAKILHREYDTHRDALRGEAEIYEMLEPLWGVAVPDFLGLFEGEGRTGRTGRMGRTGRTVLLLSYEGEPIEDGRLYQKQIYDRLCQIHALQVEHNDVRPANILRRPDGSVCLVDFHMATVHAGVVCEGECGELVLWRPRAGGPGLADEDGDGDGEKGVR